MSCPPIQNHEAIWLPLRPLVDQVNDHVERAAWHLTVAAYAPDTGPDTAWRYQKYQPVWNIAEAFESFQQKQSIGRYRASSDLLIFSFIQAYRYQRNVAYCTWHV
ncbi:hypothetical protein N7509_002117 [Penicillium cosmopolitanum]|uniref:Uncharacterized protein n=1 Tax=Penicillium cosmopolitanum TaxID=1131564 RepID=A0A9W9W8G0_9EURO|nr:uncharacterized protein N7509_002117 [Penicillium cosmopolitanum]KAJ5408234.1 hypothetical protein N7509_002117 [Penicillium cosmopolitanum]